MRISRGCLGDLFSEEGKRSLSQGARLHSKQPTPAFTLDVASSTASLTACEATSETTFSRKTSERILQQSSHDMPSAAYDLTNQSGTGCHRKPGCVYLTAGMTWDTSAEQRTFYAKSGTFPSACI